MGRLRREVQSHDLRGILFVRLGPCLGPAPHGVSCSETPAQQGRSIPVASAVGLQRAYLLLPAGAGVHAAHLAASARRAHGRAHGRARSRALHPRYTGGRHLVRGLGRLKKP